jgi:hypothetical protein
MGVICVSIATFLYLMTSVSCLLQGDYPHCLMWAGYTFANIGLLWYECSKLGF